MTLTRAGPGLPCLGSGSRSVSEELLEILALVAAVGPRDVKASATVRLGDRTESLRKWLAEELCASPVLGSDVILSADPLRWS